MLNALVIGSVFLLILSLWSAGVLMWRMRQRNQEETIHRRLGLIDDEDKDARVLRLWREGEEVTTQVPGLERHRSLAEWAAHIHREAGFAMPLASLLLATASAGVLVAALTYLATESILLTVLGLVVLTLVIKTYVQRRLSRQRAVFENQLVDALELAARSLRAGHPLAGAFQLISEEIAHPVGSLFADIGEQQAFGATLDESLRKASDDTNSPDFHLFSVSVAIQIRAGGNLADMMERVAYVIRDRLRLTRRVRVLTAQTQFSKNVLITIPVMLFVFLNLISPEYMANLYTTFPGRVLITLAIAGLGIGMWVMNRMAVLRY